MTIIIRKAQAGDVPGLGKLLASTGWWEWINTAPAAEVEAYIAASLAADNRDDSHSVVVAVDEQEQVVGYCAIHWLPYLFLKGPEGFISELFVSESTRGKGVGRRLLEWVQEEASRRGCARLSLLNSRARESYKRAFYTKNGWVERESIANFILPLPAQDDHLHKNHKPSK